MGLVADALFQLRDAYRRPRFRGQGLQHALLQGTPHAMAPTTRLVAAVLAAFDLGHPTPTGQNKHLGEQRLEPWKT
jgi:hypothetical protein